MACSQGDIAVAKVLLEAGANVNIRTFYGGDALSTATQDMHGNGCALILLLANYRANLDPKTEIGEHLWLIARYTPDMRAAIVQAIALQKAKTKK